MYFNNRWLAITCITEENYSYWIVTIGRVLQRENGDTSSLGEAEPFKIVSSTLPPLSSLLVVIK